MKHKIKNILCESIIFRHTNEKFNKKVELKEAVVTDPYYRFGRVLEEMRQRIPLNGPYWLDLGCHHGQFIELVNNTFDYNAIGIDDWELKTEMPYTDFKYYKADLSNSNWTNILEEKSLNVITALEVLEHMIDTVKFVNNCKKILSDKGVLVITTPNINSLRNRVMVPLGKYPAGLEYKNVIHHVRLFNVKTISDLLGQNGYRVLKICGVSFLPEKLLKYSFLDNISKIMANMFPSLCGNIIVMAQKN